MTKKEITIEPDHLKLGRVDPDKQELINNVNSRCPFYMYSQAESIIQSEMFPLFRDAITNNTFRGKIHFLYGDYNTGKSYLLQYVTELIRYHNKVLWKPSHRPIQIMDLRDDINTAKQFYLYLLNQLNDPMDPNRLKKWKLTNTIEINLRDRVIKTLERLRTRILILDECQRLLKAKNQDIPNIFEALKDLTNKKYWRGDLRTQFVICGTDEAYNILSVENWIQGRTYTIRLEELTRLEYPKFLLKIYYDYVDLGISENWNLCHIKKETGTEELNHELADFLYQKSMGRVGLTVDIIKDAIKRALNNNRMYPILEDYQLVISGNKALDIERSEMKRIEIVLDYHDKLCVVERCPRFKKPYEYHKDLLRHYKKKHPEYILKNKDGHEIR